MHLVLDDISFPIVSSANSGIYNLRFQTRELNELPSISNLSSSQNQSTRFNPTNATSVTHLHTTFDQCHFTLSVDVRLPVIHSKVQLDLALLRRRSLTTRTKPGIFEPFHVDEKKRKFDRLRAETSSSNREPFPLPTFP